MIEIKRHINAGKDKHFPTGEYHYSPVVDGKEYSQIAETEDMAMLIGIGIKYDGINTRFPQMAARMLRINSEWAE